MSDQNIQSDPQTNAKLSKKKLAYSIQTTKTFILHHSQYSVQRVFVLDSGVIKHFLDLKALFDNILINRWTESVKMRNRSQFQLLFLQCSILYFEQMCLRGGRKTKEHAIGVQTSAPAISAKIPAVK